MVEEPSSPQEHSPTRIIKDVMSILEPQGFEIAIVFLGVDEEVKCWGDDDVPKDGGPEAEAQAGEMIEVVSGDEEVPQVADEGKQMHKSLKC